MKAIVGQPVSVKDGLDHGLSGSYGDLASPGFNIESTVR